MVWRLANSNDSYLFFQWANDPDVRKNAFNQEPIKWENHQKWFSDRLESHNSLLLIFFDNNEPVGQVRIEWEKAGGVIDFSVAATERGKGWGAKMLVELSKLHQKLPNTPLLQGIVKQDNKASQNAFIKAGFHDRGLRTIAGETCIIFEINND